MKPGFPRVGITGKVLLYLFLISIVPLLVVGWSVYELSRSTLQQEVSAYNKRLVHEYTENVDLLCAEIDGLIANIAGVEDIREVLDTDKPPEDDYTRLATKAKIGYILSGYSRIEGLASIDIFARGGQYFHLGDTLDMQSIREEVKFRVFAAAESSDRQVVWVGIEDNINSRSKHKLVIPAVRALQKLDGDQSQTFAHLLVNYDVDHFHKQFERVQLADGGFLMIVDRNGRIVYHTTKDELGKHVNAGFHARLRGKSGSFVETVAGREMSVTYDQSDRSGWHIVNFIPVESLAAQAVYVRDRAVLLLAASLVFIVILAFFFSRSLVAPVRRITDAFEQIQDDTMDWSARLEVRRRDEIGELTTWFNTFLDSVEGKRRAERELVEAKEAAEKAREAAEHAREAAEEANQAKSEFLANMSHELRTPLNGMIGTTILAMETELTEEQQEYLTMVQSSSDWLLTLVNDILDFSKLDAGKLELANERFQLRDELSSRLRPLALLAHEKNLELIFDIPANVPDTLLGDAKRVNQIVINLVGNAIKFTERGEVVVTVGFKPRSSREISLLITVRDTGIGISRDQKESIFEGFAQADASTTRKFGGTGLGLSIATQLATMMNGHIEVESELGVGSTFRLDVRLERPVDSAERFTRPIRPLPSSSTSMPVLVVDDNDTARGVALEMLRRQRLDPTGLDSGAALLATVAAAASAGAPMPLILLDARMPDIDGFAVAERLVREHALARHIIMMLTIDKLGSSLARCHELGIGRHITKPLRASLLNDTLGKALRDILPDQSKPSMISRSHTSSLRVLIVEDNPLNQKVVTRLLERKGHDVEVAENGAIALDRLAASPDGYDVVLMDIQMPIMDGLEATAAIRQNEHDRGGHHLPIIAVTAHTLKANRDRCKAVGMDGFVEKPIHPDELYSTIESVCRGANAGRREPTLH